MIEVSVAYPKDTSYPVISSFAQAVYSHEFGAHVEPAPDVFVYATTNECMVGCLGLYQAREHEPLLFETYVPNAYGRLSGICDGKRSMLGELGTRVVQLSESPKTLSGDVSLAMTALLVSVAHRAGIRYVGFTTTRLVKRITDQLGFTLVTLGKPDLSGKDQVFRQNWEKFFRVPQICAGFHISSLTGCEMAATRLRSRGIVIRNST